MSKKRKRARIQTREGDLRYYPKLEKILEEAEGLIEAGKAGEAIELLRPLAGRYGQSGEFQNCLGFAYIQTGDLWTGATCYKKAVELRSDPGIWLPLGFIYLELSLEVLGLEALRRAARQNLEPTIREEVQQAISMVETTVQNAANGLNLPLITAEEGLRLMEEGQIALHETKYMQCINLNRRAIKILGDFPPPYNNLSLALFFHGQPQDAIDTARKVLENHPENIHALGNLVRFLAWTGQASEAQVCWETLRALTPPNDDLRVKMIESAAIAEDDQSVVRLGKELERKAQDYGLQMNYHLAVAEANLGLPSARTRFKRLIADHPLVSRILQALKNGQQGLGWAKRFPYYHISEMIPKREFGGLIDLMQQLREDHPESAHREIERFARRFPQVALMGMRTILEEQQFEAGIQLLSTVGSPAAYNALREFGLSQLGSDEARMKALLALLNAKQMPSGETLRVWRNGEWQDVQLRSYEVKDAALGDYPPEAASLLDQGLRSFREGKFQEAEERFLHTLEIEPRAKEAYNNLGTIYARLKDHNKARHMYQKALEIDPLYIIPRCNLATYLLDGDDLNAAEAMLAPLNDVDSYTPQAFGFVSYVRARIAVNKENYDEAKNLLKITLEVSPDTTQAEELLQRIEFLQNLRSGFNFWEERRLKRQESDRARLQKQLSTSDPTIAESLGLYTKDILVGITRAVIPWGGWSGLKKAQLHQYLVDNLLNPVVLDGLVDSLEPEAIEALRLTLDRGGSIPWKDFDEVYGNDLEDSPYWHYHEPETVMGRLRARGLLVEASVDGQLILAIPVELRELLKGRV